MPTHDSLLKRLWEAFPGHVYLVGRYANDTLGLPEDDILRVFIPDLHWLSNIAQSRYPAGYGFTGNHLINGKPVFGTLLDVLEDVRDVDVPAAGGGLEIFQVGDAFDLWREKTPQEPDVKAAYLRMCDDPVIGPLAGRLAGLDVKFTTGNHDHWLPDALNAGGQQLDTQRERTAADGRIRVTHGHEYDNIEMGLPDSLQAIAVWIATQLRISQHTIGVFTTKAMDTINMVLNLREKAGLRKDFYPTVEPDGACVIRNNHDVQNAGQVYQTYLDVSRFSKTPGIGNDFDHVDYLRYADLIVAAELNHPQDHCMHVIGHTHRARLLVDVVRPEQSYVVLDCGSWLGVCKIMAGTKKTATFVPSAQIGVQYANDVRLYQLGGIET